VSTSGETTVSIGHETEGEHGTTSVGLEVSSEGNFTASAEHEFNNDVTASAEITNDSITLALGRTWNMPEVNSWTYLLPPSPATFGLGVVLSARLNGSAGIEAKEAINFTQGTSSIAINTKGTLSGTVQVTGEALGIIQAGGNSRLTATIKGSGELVFNGTNISPNASITANLVLSFNVVIGLSESIISAARAFDVSREDLTFEYPISALELLKVVGVRINNGSITGTPSFEPGKDLERVKSAINSGVQRIKAAWERIKHYNPIILTGVPRGCPTAREQKIKWCQRELGPHVKVITCLTSHKVKYCLPNSILLDDRNVNLELWKYKGGKFILYNEDKLDEIAEKIDRHMSNDFPSP
jgi:hypothetical protein